MVESIIASGCQALIKIKPKQRFHPFKFGLLIKLENAIQIPD